MNLREEQKGRWSPGEVRIGVADARVFWPIALSLSPETKLSVSSAISAPLCSSILEWSMVQTHYVTLHSITKNRIEIIPLPRPRWGRAPRWPSSRPFDGSAAGVVQQPELNVAAAWNGRFDVHAVLHSSVLHGGSQQRGGCSAKTRQLSRTIPSQPHRLPQPIQSNKQRISSS
eukprot:363093-Rhodomonas_salina.1